MGRIARRWRRGGIVAGIAAAAAGMAYAQRAGVPQLGYAALPADARVSLSGAIVRPPMEAFQELRLRTEMARVAKAQTYSPQPAIWRIGDADTTIYLFGTVHSLPPGFRWRNPGLEAVILRADTLILESSGEPEDEVTFLEGIPGGGALPPLIDRVSHRTRARLAELQAALPAEAIAELDRMPSWLAAITIGQLRDMLAGDIPAQGADEWLRRNFRARGRPVQSIEDSKAVVTSINAVPEQAQRLMLESALLAPLRSHDEQDATAHAWAQGQVGEDSPLRILPGGLDPSDALSDPMLRARNAAWTQTLAAHLRSRRGTLLFAAGAGHFVGPGSVLELLGRLGLRVERVQ